jgi:hypothetical protein
MTLTDHFQPLVYLRRPAALVGGFLLQCGGALFWAGSAAERITVLERETESSRHAIERVAVLEEQVTAIRQTLDRIETKLDRREEGGERTR